MAINCIRLVVAAAFATQLAVAQCGWQTQPGSLPGVSNEVLVSHLWDPDGSGPQPDRLVVGGHLSVAGSEHVEGLAIYDDATGTWQPVGSITTSSVFEQATVAALATMPNGDLIVGGDFQFAGGVAAANVARFDGQVWTALGTGTNQVVNALLVLPNGDLIVGGEFTSAGSGSASAIARWDGTSWSTFGAGLSWPGGQTVSVSSLAQLGNGDLIAGGWFTQAGSSTAVGIASWNGSSWSDLGGGMNSGVSTLDVLVNGDLVVGGRFGSAGGVTARGIARWDGSSWSGLGSGMTLVINNFIGDVRDVIELPSGDLVAVGNFETADGNPAQRVARWDGSGWSPLGAGVGGHFIGADVAHTACVMPGGDLFVGGKFSTAGAAVAHNVARWHGTSWSRLTDGIDKDVWALAELPNGDLIAGGFFKVIGTATQHIARWDGTSWSPLGTGVDGLVQAIAAMPNGDIIAGGYFQNAGSIPVEGIARWDGSQWHATFSGFLSGDVQALCVRQNGQLVGVGSGQWGVRTWNGSSWLGLGGSATTAQPTVRAVIELPNGDIVVGGDFGAIAGVTATRVARFDGTTWHAMGNGVQGAQPSVYCLALGPDGTLYAGGTFTSVGGATCNGVASWDGTAWSPLGTTPPGTAGPLVLDLETLPDGNVLAGGYLPGSFGQLRGLKRFNGSVWSALGGNIGTVRSIQRMVDGQVWLGGSFATFAGVSTPYLAQLQPVCPATVIDLGGGCTGSGGSNQLSAPEPAWIGSTFRTNGSGLSSPSLVAAVYGFAPASLPLVTVLPLALPGCDLLVSPDYVDVLVAAIGEVDTALTIPPSSTLAGTVLHHQLVPFELDAGFNIVAVTASNALRITIGSL